MLFFFGPQYSISAHIHKTLIIYTYKVNLKKTCLFILSFDCIFCIMIIWSNLYIKQLIVLFSKKKVGWRHCKLYYPLSRAKIPFLLYIALHRCNNNIASCVSGTSKRGILFRKAKMSATIFHHRMIWKLIKST